MAAPARPEDEPSFDALAYGRPAPTQFDRASHFDRTFTFQIGRKPGFLDGRPGRHWTINGGIYPDVRKAESRYMPVLLRDTIESTGQWGQVRVLPGASSTDRTRSECTTDRSPPSW